MMPLFSNILATLGLLTISVRGSPHDGHHVRPPYHNESTIYDPVCTENVTFTDTTTLFSTTVVPVTQYVNITVNSTETDTKTSTVIKYITVSTTNTLNYTVSNTETDLETVTDTETDLETITNTETATTTVPATVTTYTTQTIFSTTFDPCPTTCSVSAGTVSLLFWPSDRPYSYPSTYVDPDLDYTFTSPSVYMIIPTIVGTNSLGTTGPSTTSWILELDLEEVSTIADGSVTRQLTLSHLGTDCPQSADASAIATMSDSRCAPILAAPDQVSSWAYPCNACGDFGLFDPPYAVPTVTGGILGTTTVTEVTEEPTPTSDEVSSVESTVVEPPPTSEAVSSTESTIVEEPVPTSEAVSSVDSTVEDPATSGVTETQTSSDDLPASAPTTDATVTADLPTTTPPVGTGLATKVIGGSYWLILTTITAVLLF